METCDIVFLMTVCELEARMPDKSSSMVAVEHINYLVSEGIVSYGILAGMRILLVELE